MATRAASRLEQSKTTAVTKRWLGKSTPFTTQSQIIEDGASLAGRLVDASLLCDGSYNFLAAGSFNARTGFPAKNPSIASRPSPYMQR